MRQSVLVFIVGTFTLCNIASCDTSVKAEKPEVLSLYSSVFSYGDRPASVYLEGSLGGGGDGAGAGTLARPASGGHSCCLSTFAGETVKASIQYGYSAEQEKQGYTLENYETTVVIPEPECPGKSRFLTIHIYPNHQLKLYIRNMTDAPRKEDGSLISDKSLFKEGTYTCANQN